MKKKHVYFSLIILVFVFTISSFKATNRFELVKSLEIFSDLFEEINTLYVDDIQAEELVKNGIDGMLESLDPYTVYYPESEIEDYKLMTTGQYGGIGARIRKVDDYLVIQEIFEGSPSMKAGLKPGDAILEVDGNEIKNQTSYELSKLLKGTPGTAVEMKILRLGTKKELTKTFNREEIKISSVPFHGMIDEEVGYIKMTSFTRQVSDELQAAFLELKKEKGMKKLVLDLRGNPGGLLVESINIVNLFTPKGTKVVETKGKIENWNKEYKNINKSIDEEIPIVVLVNEGSASASEIVSGALQDLDRAVILGKNTYGKGLVQTTVKLKYNSSLKVTTAKYYIPSGRCIQEVNYSKKDKNGRGVKKPDSLRLKFKTLNGREVEDGHGIQPDVELDKTPLNYIVKSILKENHIFNFINEYAAELDSVAIPSEFKLNSNVFDEFIQYLENKTFIYSSQTEKNLDKVLEKAEEEQLLDYVKTDLEAMQKKLNAKKIDEIRKHQKEIEKYLKKEIITRFYYRKGNIEISLKTDNVVNKAKEILNNQTLYKSYLSN